MGIAEPRDSHDQRLALLERGAPGVGLRRVGIGLDHLRPLPEPMHALFVDSLVAPSEQRPDAQIPVARMPLCQVLHLFV